LPEIQTTEIVTRVSLPDQGTVMLGGLTLAAENEIVSGVPVLGKIPLIGRLFSSNSEVKDKQILLILVKPTILLRDENEADAVAALQD
jgi:type II secretory pathway component GspD/PulD (secretin)